MEQKNKEIPTQFEQPSTEMATPEVVPSLETEGFIVEQPMTVEEKQELTEQLSGQAEVTTTTEEVKAVAPQERVVGSVETDKTYEHLKGDSREIKDSDAYEIINDLMNSGS